MAMDGVVSSGMRAYGLEYKLNFGVPVMKIKDIASRYMPDSILAERLWQDNTRELKILATVLYPKDEFTRDVAWRWVREIPNQEIREQLSMNLLRYLPYTYSFCLECAGDENSNIRTTGYWSLGKYIAECGFVDEVDYNAMPYIWYDMESGDLFLHNAVKLLLKNAGRVSAQKANEILGKLAAYKDSENPLLREAFESLTFDYRFYHGNLIQ